MSQRNPMSRFNALVAILAVVGCSQAAVQPYPQYPGEPASTLFSATVDDAPVLVHSTDSYKAAADYLRFAFTGTVTVTVNLLGGTISRAPSISPRVYGIALTRNGNSVTFTLDRPRKLILYMGNSTLLIFAEAPEVNPPKPGDSNVKNIMDYAIDATGGTVQTTKINNAINELSGTGGTRVLYFPRGVYLTGSIIMKSNVTLYLAPDALIRLSGDAADLPRLPRMGFGSGAFVFFENLRNAGIRGRGTLTAGGYVREARGLTGNWDIQSLVFHSCKNTFLDGFILLDSFTWNFHPVDCDTLSCVNVKAVSSIEHQWNDGFDVDVCSDVLVDDCFYWGSDDGLCVKGTSGVPDRATERILFRNCVVASYTANGFRFGYYEGGDESRWTVARNIEFRDVNFLNWAAHGIRLNPGPHPAEDLRFINCTFEQPPSKSSQAVILYLGTDDGFRSATFENTTSYITTTQMQIHTGTVDFHCTKLPGRDVTSLQQAMSIGFLTNIGANAVVTFDGCDQTPVRVRPAASIVNQALLTMGTSVLLTLSPEQQLLGLVSASGRTVDFPLVNRMSGNDRGTVDLSGVTRGTYFAIVGNESKIRTCSQRIVIP